MSTFMFAGVNNLSKTASGIGNFPPNFLNKEPEKGQQATGLLSKGRQFAIKLIFYGLYLCFTILRRFVPSFIVNFFIFIIPPVLAFYELGLRVYFPRLPSLFSIAVKLFQRRILTVDTIIWLASSLPTDFLCGLGALGGVAMQTTAAMAGGAASLGNALGGTATGLVGNASKTVAQGINHLKPGVVATDITHVLSDGSRIAADHATSITSLIKNSETVVKENISHLISSETAISPGHLVPDIAKNAVHTVVGNTSAITDSAVGATKAAVTDNTAKLAHVLDSVNPLHLHITSTGSESKDAQAQAISASDPLLPSNANATKPLGMVGAAKAVATENVAKAANVLESANPLHINVLSKGSEASHRDQHSISSIGGLLRPKLPGLS